jgi:hypothetical protein
MKRYGIRLCALVSFAALTLPCVAQDNNSQSNPWNGSWQIDRSTLKYDGPTVSIATDADGYTITRNGKASPKVVCNGQPNAPSNGTVTTCTKTANGYDLVNTRDGKTVSKVKVETSADGATMTRTAVITPADGSAPFTMTFSSKKISGGNGAPTVWKETSFNESQDTGVLTIQVNGDSISFKETDNDKPVTSKLDGTPTSLGGSRTVTTKLAGPHTLKVTYLMDGKIARENTFMLSDDGKTIQEIDVTPAPSASTMSVMFNKS